jgi:hypothetical protein
VSAFRRTNDVRMTVSQVRLKPDTTLIRSG